MEEMVYGLLINESPFTTASEKEQFHAVSNDWHRLLQFDSAYEKSRVEPGVERRMAAEREAAELRRYRQMRDVDIDVELVRFYGNADAGFRGIQEAALRAIIYPQVSGGPLLWTFAVNLGLHLKNNPTRKSAEVHCCGPLPST
jgi:hypothetical protein